MHRARAGHLYEGHLFHQTARQMLPISLSLPSPPLPSLVALGDAPPSSPSRHLSSCDRHFLCHNLRAVLLECSSVSSSDCSGGSACRATQVGRRSGADGGVARQIESVGASAEMNHRSRQGLAAHSEIFWGVHSGLPSRVLRSSVTLSVEAVAAVTLESTLVPSFSPAAPLRASSVAP